MKNHSFSKFIFYLTLFVLPYSMQADWKDDLSKGTTKWIGGGDYPFTELLPKMTSMAAQHILTTTVATGVLGGGSWLVYKSHKYIKNNYLTSPYQVKDFSFSLNQKRAIKKHQEQIKQWNNLGNGKYRFNKETKQWQLSVTKEGDVGKDMKPENHLGPIVEVWHDYGEPYPTTVCLYNKETKRYLKIAEKKLSSNPGWWTWTRFVRLFTGKYKFEWTDSKKIAAAIINAYGCGYYQRRFIAKRVERLSAGVKEGKQEIDKSEKVTIEPAELAEKAARVNTFLAKLPVHQLRVICDKNNINKSNIVLLEGDHYVIEKKPLVFTFAQQKQAKVFEFDMNKSIPSQSDIMQGKSSEWYAFTEQVRINAKKAPVVVFLKNVGEANIRSWEEGKQLLHDYLHKIKNNANIICLLDMPASAEKSKNILFQDQQLFTADDKKDLSITSIGLSSPTPALYEAILIEELNKKHLLKDWYGRENYKKNKESINSLVHVYGIDSSTWHKSLRDAFANAKSTHPEEVLTYLDNYLKEERLGLADIIRKPKDALVGGLYDPFQEALENLDTDKHTKPIIIGGKTGTGKSSQMRHFAWAARSKGSAVLIINSSKLLNPYVGKSEANLEKVIMDARDLAKTKKTIVMFDEAEEIIGKRKEDNDSNAMNSIKTSFVNRLLKETEGIEGKSQKIIFVFATNFPERLDDAIKGRSDVIIQPALDTEANLETISNIMYSKYIYYCEQEELPSDSDITADYFGNKIKKEWGLSKITPRSLDHIVKYAVEKYRKQNKNNEVDLFNQLMDSAISQEKSKEKSK